MRLHTLPWQIASLALIGGLAAGAAMAADTAAVIKQDASTVSISFDGSPVLVYRYGDAPFKPYVKELYTPAGVQILRDSPHDHVHHRGLMFGLQVNGADYWGEHARSGKQRNAGLAVRQDISSDGVSHVSCISCTQTLRWTPPGEEQPVLAERRTIEARFDKGLRATLLTWQTELKPEPGRKSITLTGTHYDGLGIRFVESMDKGGRFLYACDQPGPIVRGTERVTATRWCAYSAVADGKPVTVALFDHPANPRRPAGMFSMAGHFAYLSVTPNVWKRPMTIEADKPLHLRYGVALWDGKVERDEIEQTYKTWAEGE